MTHPSAKDPRLVELEIQLTHLQYDYEQLNSVCLEQQSQIAKQSQRIGRLEELLGRLLGKLDIPPEDLWNSLDSRP